MEFLKSKKIVFELYDKIPNTFIIDINRLTKIIDPIDNWKRYINNIANQETKDDIQQAFNLLEIEDLGDIGLVGSSQIDKFSKNSDIDFMFYKGIKENLRIYKKILEIIEQKEKRVTMGHKITPLRFYIGNTLMCCQFGLKEEEVEYHEKLLKGEFLKVTQREYYGCVTDITYSIYSPTIVSILDQSTQESIPIIMYHGARRGEYYISDEVSLSGNEYILQQHRYILTLDMAIKKPHNDNWIASENNNHII